jgi:hypothetical protein
MWRRTVDCVGVAVGITSLVAEIEAPLAAVLRSYPQADRPTDLEYLLEVDVRPRLVKNGVLVRRHQVAIDLVAALELDMNREVTSRAAGLLLHAGAVVGAGGDAIVFAGRSGAGKSTLIRALVADGFAYLTEECVSLLPGRACAGMARPFHVDDDDVPLPPGFTSDEYPLRQKDGSIRSARIFHPPAHAIWRGSARAAAVVLIDHAPDARAAVDPMTGGAALAELWPLVFRPDRAALADAALILADIARFRMRSARPDQAVAGAVGLAAELGVQPL